MVENFPTLAVCYTTKHVKKRRVFGRPRNGGKSAAAKEEKDMKSRKRCKSILSE